jgi:hypothetical protein
MSDGDWLVALGALLTGVGTVLTIIIDCRQGDDLTDLQEEILREEKKRWTDGGKKGPEPDAGAAGKAAKTAAKRRRLWRLVPLGVLAVAAVLVIAAGLVVG